MDVRTTVDEADELVRWRLPLKDCEAWIHNVSTLFYRIKRVVFMRLVENVVAVADVVEAAFPKYQHFINAAKYNKHLAPQAPVDEPVSDHVAHHPGQFVEQDCCT